MTAHSPEPNVLFVRSSSDDYEYTGILRYFLRIFARGLSLWVPSWQTEKPHCMSATTEIQPQSRQPWWWWKWNKKWHSTIAALQFTPLVGGTNALRGWAAASVNGLYCETEPLEVRALRASPPLLLPFPTLSTRKRSRSLWDISARVGFEKFMPRISWKRRFHLDSQVFPTFYSNVS